MCGVREREKCERGERESEREHVLLGLCVVRESVCFVCVRRARVCVCVCVRARERRRERESELCVCVCVCVVMR